MSDMSRPNPMPPAADHERHDLLLVAQLVAGDPLEPGQQAEARRLVDGCGACAALASDLPAVAHAVAQETVPSRRRDFRLTAEQAQQLRGTVLTRLLRRFSLPSSRAFQPAAAGVLSIGLLFVAAGYVWPDGGTITVQAEPNLIDWSSAAPSLTTADDLAEEPAAAPATEPEAGRDVSGEDALDGAARLMEDPEFAESLAESQAGRSEELQQKALVEQDVVDLPEAESLELGALADQIEPPADGDALADQIEPPADGDAAAEYYARARVPNAAAPGEGAREERATLASAQAADEGPEELLVLVGLVLALGGGGLLLLGRLARRARDPLAP